jgi:hypothetical protein
MLCAAWEFHCIIIKPIHQWMDNSFRFYDKFEPNEKRRGMVYTTPNAPPNPANEINVGFLFGQQYDYFSGDPLDDGSGAPLIFTREVHLIEAGSNYRQQAYDQ